MSNSQYIQWENSRILQSIVSEPVFIPYVDEDALIHTDEHPFCSDRDCPCLEDEKFIRQFFYFFDDFEDGLLTIAEARVIYEGRNI